MPIQPSVSVLSATLQEVSEALAATSTPEAIFDIILNPALQALGGLGGAIFLVDDRGTLRIAARYGHQAEERLVWQDGSLASGTPVGDVVLARAPQFFHHRDALLNTYPDLESRTGARAPVATALLPMGVDDRALGAIAIDFADPHDFSPEEQRFLKILSAQGGLAVDRLRLMTELRARAEERQRQATALTSFISLTAAVGATTDVDALIRMAEQVLGSVIPGVISAYFEVQGEQWVARIATDERPQALHDVITAGLPVSTPSFARAVAQRSPLFVDHWNAAAEGVPFTEQFQIAALAPYFRHGLPVSMFTVGAEQPESWSAEHREMFLAVARSLGSALERADEYRRQERQAALDAFVALTESIGTETDQQRLAERAKALLLAFLPGWSVVYYTVEDGLWRASTLEVPDAELAVALRAGVPMDTPAFAEAIQQARPVFVEDWKAKDQHMERTDKYGSAGFYPYFTDGQPCGMFVVGTQDSPVWHPGDQAVFLVVGRSLELALEWATHATLLRRQNDALRQQTQQLELERAGLDAFVTFTLAVGGVTSVLELAQQAIRTIHATVPEVSAVYFEPEHARWTARVWSDDLMLDVLEQLVAGVPMDAPNFTAAIQAGAGQFVEAWDVEAHHLSAVPAAPDQHAAFFPILVHGQPHGFLTAGKQHRRWTAREQGVIRAVVQGMQIALEHTLQTDQLRQQRDELDARAAALTVVNQELEAFAYSASHDLRTPVRHVLSFADLAKRALQHAQSDKLEHHLSVIQDSAERMTDMIDGMLVLSQIGRERLMPRLISLEPLIVQAQRAAHAAFPTLKVEWRVSGLQPVWADPKLLQQVLLSLLGNAVKFSSGQDVAVIALQVEGTEHEWVISVRDNGVGFDTRYTDKLFQVFQRLHLQSEFPGSGVGLAAMRKIVTKHAGRVFAESDGTTGAVFGFTLPRALQRP
ncbi:GAF domain-containing sensor histidine kinase [Deinococcus koreensis]|uniref:histidine kinase n=1 Tax=Deinococcus koreensis TaxID=2054903 RepID=A0A2K3URT9_9DEIO|nr:GAF domain-containing protein [Deinococcus koreensis]PNY79259.1 hypothetical protein CVO96_20305 [Deinococcus koreensis]